MSHRRGSLPRPARQMVTGVTLSSVGSGMTLPFTLILLHLILGYTLAVSGLLMAVPAAIGLVSVPVSGALSDWLTPRLVLRTGLVLQVLSTALLPHARLLPVAMLAMVLQGLGRGPSLTAAGVLLGGVAATEEQRSRAFSLQFTAINAGMGAGALIGALVISASHPWTFTLLFTANAVLTMSYAFFVPGRPDPAPAVAERGHRGRKPGSYRDAFGDPAFRLLCLIALLLALTGYAAIDSGLPAYVVVVGHVAPRVVAATFVVNTATIVLAQPLVSRVLRTRRRSDGLAGAGLLWALSWTLLGGGVLLPGGLPRTAAVLVFGAVFGLGECVLAPALAPMVNALAPAELRGRYNAMYTWSFALALVAAPALSGGLIGARLPYLWLGLVIGGCLAAVPMTLLLRRLYPGDKPPATTAGVAAEEDNPGQDPESAPLVDGEVNIGSAAD